MASAEWFGAVVGEAVDMACRQGLLSSQVVGTLSQALSEVLPWDEGEIIVLVPKKVAGGVSLRTIVVPQPEEAVAALVELGEQRQRETLVKVREELVAAGDAEALAEFDAEQAAYEAFRAEQQANMVRAQAEAEAQAEAQAAQQAEAQAVCAVAEG